MTGRFRGRIVKKQGCRQQQVEGGDEDGGVLHIAMMKIRGHLHQLRTTGRVLHKANLGSEIFACAIEFCICLAKKDYL